MATKQNSSNSNQNPFTADPFSFFQNFTPTGGTNFESAMDSQRRNIETATQVSQTAADAAKAIAQAQTQYTRQIMEDTASFIRSWMNTGTDMQDKMDLQSQTLQEGMNRAVEHGRELSGIYSKSQEKITKLTTSRFNEAVQETTNTAKSTTRKAS
ncbi:MAG: TIGR01841 family phasin [Alphaproteobacteria bacterium]